MELRVGFLCNCRSLIGPEVTTVFVHPGGDIVNCHGESSHGDVHIDVGVCNFGHAETAHYFDPAGRPGLL